MNILINRLGLLVFSLLFISCYSYRQISISQRVMLSEKTVDKRLLTEKKTNKISYKRMYREKFLAKICDFSVLSKINNRGVRLALDGKYIEAEILFRDIIKEKTGKDLIGNNDKLPDMESGAIFNNLGVVCELSGKRDQAFQMYSIACLIEPGNRYFRKNFLTFVNTKER
ncbi:hypothetical protein ACFL20_13460 [Spirochaetota bacterium]